MPETARALYIIHAADDKKLAKYLKSEFESNVPGLRAFVASKAGQIPTGKPWLTEIQQNLQAATTFLALLTPRSILRPWVFYEAGVAWKSGLPWLPVAAAGLDPNDIPLPLGASQALVLEDEDGAIQLFQDVGGDLEDAADFCAMVKQLSLPLPTLELDNERTREVHQAFAQLGDPPRFILRRMLTVGGMTLGQMAADLEKEHFVHDMTSVEHVRRALDERHLVQGDFEGRWRIKPELEPALIKCFDRPLSLKMTDLADELLSWIAGSDGLIDTNMFDQRFRARLKAVAEKAVQDYGENDAALESTPSSGGGVRRIAAALKAVANRLPPR